MESPERLCRCSDVPHRLEPSCYTPGPAPRDYVPTAELVEADADAVADAVELVLDRLTDVALSAPARKAIAEALDVEPDDVGIPMTRKAARRG